MFECLSSIYIQVKYAHDLVMNAAVCFVVRPTLESRRKVCHLASVRSRHVRMQELHARLYRSSNLLKHTAELQKLFWLRRCHEFGFTDSSTELQRPYVLGAKTENTMPCPYRHYSKLAGGSFKVRRPLILFL